MTVKKSDAAAGVGKKNAAQLQAMLLKPTNNLGLASLFKNFVDINQSNQQGQVSQKFKSPCHSTRISLFQYWPFNGN